MIQCQLKLRLTKAQDAELDRWLYHLTSVWNWGIRKIELNAANKIYFRRDFNNILAGHSKQLEIPSHVIQGVLSLAYTAWDRCFKKTAGQPRLKGQHNKLNSLPFPDPINPAKGNRITLLGIGTVRFHKQDIPQGRIKCARIIKRASGWHLCLFIDADPNPIPRISEGTVGIDPGFSSLLTTSSGEVISHPRELEAAVDSLSRAQRGRNKRLAARIHERILNRRKDRNHKLSRRLVSENIKIVFSKDPIKGMAKRFGKSVTSSGHAQLRSMLSYKSAYSGTEYIEVASKNSTRTCSECGSLSGPTGFAGLSVRQWVCPCGAEHDRDVNAAINTLIAGAGFALELAYANQKPQQYGEITAGAGS